MSFASAIPSTSSIGTGVSGTGRYSNSSPREGRRRLARSRYLLVLVGLGLVLAFVGAVPTVEAATNGPSTSRSSVGTILPNVSCAQPNHCVVVGRTSVLATTSNGGSSWVLHRSRQNYLQGVSCPTANRCMVASYGAILKTTNDWATSKVVFYGGDAVAYGKRGLSNLNAVSCPSIAGCIAVGQEGGPPGNAGAIVTTRNAGATWKTLVIPSLYSVELVSCPTANDCIAVGRIEEDSAPVTLDTTDGGSTWQAHRTPHRFFPAGISCASSSHCMMVGFIGATTASGATEQLYEAMVTTNGGTSWTPENNVEKFLGGFYAVSCPTASDCTAVGTAVITTSNGGATWTLRVPYGETQLGTGPGDDIDSVSCATSRYCMAVSQNRHVIVTTDGGITWTRRVSPAL